MLFSCNFDDQLSQNFHKIVVWCICWDTASEKTVFFWQLPKVSTAFKWNFYDEESPGRFILDLPRVFFLRFFLILFSVFLLFLLKSLFLTCKAFWGSDSQRQTLTLSDRVNFTSVRVDVFTEWIKVNSEVSSVILWMGALTRLTVMYWDSVKKNLGLWRGLIKTNQFALVRVKQ